MRSPTHSLTLSKAVYNDPCKNGPFGQDEPSVPWNAVRMRLITAIQLILGHNPGDRAPPN